MSFQGIAKVSVRIPGCLVRFGIAISQALHDAALKGEDSRFMRTSDN